jgi:hypothetical protein
MDLNDMHKPINTKVQFVIGGEGEPTSVLVDIDTWNHIISVLKEAEDLVGAAQGSKKMDPDSWDLEKAGFKTWQAIREEMREQILQHELAKESITYSEDKQAPCC